MTMGRPTIFTQELADEICQKIKHGVRGVQWLSDNNPHWPDRSTIFRWMDKHPEFCAQYEKAKAAQADCMFDSMIDVSFNDQKDHKVIVDDKGNERTVVVSEAVNRSRLKVDTLKYCAARLAPKKYSERATVSEEVGRSLLETLVDKL